MARRSACADADRIVEGNRVRLRPVRPPDLGQLKDWYNDPAVFQFMGRDAPLTDADQQRWFDSQKNDPAVEVFAVEDRHEHVLLGSITLRDLTDPAQCGELGILMGLRSSGYGSEAIHTLLRHAFAVHDLNCVHLAVRGDNRRAITAYMRAGFRPEGVLRQRLLKGGRIYDLYSMSLLRDEFDSLTDLDGLQP